MAISKVNNFVCLFFNLLVPLFFIRFFLFSFFFFSYSVGYLTYSGDHSVIMGITYIWRATKTFRYPNIWIKKIEEYCVWLYGCRLRMFITTIIPVHVTPSPEYP